MADEKRQLSEPGESNRNGWSAARLTKFWQAMVGIYGQRWVREYGSTMDVVWEAELLSMTPDEALLGWQACKVAGDREPCTLSQFTRRVADALKARKRPEPYKPLPAPVSRVVPDMFKRACGDAQSHSDDVDVTRLAKALGVDKRLVLKTWPRRSMLRKIGHPAGRFVLTDIARARGQAKQQGRSQLDLELELMAYNGWTPDDEKHYQDLQEEAGQRRQTHDGETPFVRAWNGE